MEPLRREHPDDGPAAHRVNPGAAIVPVDAVPTDTVPIDTASTDCTSTDTVPTDSVPIGPRPAGVLDTYLEHRPMLLALAYRLLGSVHDAEDVVQDAYLRWASQDIERIGNPAAFLTTVVTRLCLDRLRSAAARRELYVGPWLPEPLPTGLHETPFDFVDLVDLGGGRGTDPAAATALRESASIGMLLLLERLSPAERAVFVLREAFDLPYRRIAEIIDRSVESCRQLHRRAARRVSAPPGSGPDSDSGPDSGFGPGLDAGRARPSARGPRDPARDRRIVRGFLAAAENGDIDGLAALFREDVVVLTDGGGKVSAARKPVHGAQKAARLYAHVFPARFQNSVYTFTSYNHQAALLVRRPTLDFVFVFDIDDEGLIAHLYLIANPDKLTHLTGQADYSRGSTGSDSSARTANTASCTR